MAVIKSNGNAEYVGAVLGTRTHAWLDGMVDEYAVVWDMENHELKEIQFGYYGSDGYNFIDDSAERDLTVEVARDILRTLKQHAYQEYCIAVKAKKAAIEKGIIAEVIRGRKVQKGTKLNIFWVGERPTYRSRQYSFMNETETIAGGYDEAGNKVFIKAEYLKNITPFKSPVAAERKKFIQAYIGRFDLRWNVRQVAMGGC